jgi:transcriptional regulator with XRE-family HTH domain
MSFTFFSPGETAQSVATRCQERRVALGFTRDLLAAKSGVTSASLKRFERTGRIEFTSLIKLAIALDSAEGFDQLLSKKTYRNLEEIMSPSVRKRGRRAQVR